MFLLSLPTRGAWIEMQDVENSRRITDGRSPCGERGLKYRIHKNGLSSFKSLPMRGAWIEMILAILFRSWLTVAPHAGSVD